MKNLQAGMVIWSFDHKSGTTKIRHPDGSEQEGETIDNLVRRSPYRAERQDDGKKDGDATDSP
jgi:hypothetical protein